MTKTSPLHNVFDEIFLVNLPHQPERKLKTIHTLNKLGISAKVWEATNGYSQENRREYEAYREREVGVLTFPEYNQLEVRRGSHFIDSPGAWGYLKTYRSILSWSLRNGLQRILIFEDDIVVHSQFNERVTKYLEAIGDDWKVVQFGASQYDWSSVDIERAASDGFYHPKAVHTCGSFAIGIDLSIAEELIGYVSFMEAPFDFIPLGKIYERYPTNCYVAFPNIIIADVSTSSIRGARNQVSHSERMKWNLNDYRFPTPIPIITIISSSPTQLGRLPLGNCAIESQVTINWLLFKGGAFRPVHSIESPSLAATMNHPTRDFPSRAMTEQLAYKNPSDYLVLLTEDHPYTEEEISTLVHTLVTKQVLAHGGKVIWRKGDPLTERGQERPDVSVIIPTHQRSENLENAIASVLNQTHKNIEVLVVDDNATDSDHRIDPNSLHERFNNDSRLRLLSHETNLNGAAARNTGIMASTGDFIAFLDDDDVYTPDKIEHCLTRLRQLPESYGGVYGGYVGGAFGGDFDPRRLKEGDLTEDILRLAYRDHYLHTNTTLLRRSALLAINGFDDSFRRHQDLEMMLRFFRHYRVGVVEKVVAHIRPAPTTFINRLTPEDFFNLKAKYLLRFRKIIDTFPLDRQREIYYMNWSEVKAAFSDEARFFELAVGHDPVGIGLFVYSSAILGNGSNTSIPANTPLDVAVQLRELQSAVTTLEQKNKDLQYYVDDLLKQKDWYEETYERLPYLWKKVGALIRKLKNVAKINDS